MKPTLHVLEEVGRLYNLCDSIRFSQLDDVLEELVVSAIFFELSDHGNGADNASLSPTWPCCWGETSNTLFLNFDRKHFLTTGVMSANSNDSPSCG